MTETVRYSLICKQDLALGVGTRQVRLGDASVRTLDEINIGTFLTVTSTSLRATDFNGTAVMTWSGALQAGWRVWGVTAKVTTAFGATGGLTGLRIGDPSSTVRWTNADMALTLGTETDSADFSDPSLMVFSSNTDLLVSAIGGLYDATGVLQVAIHSSLLRHPA
mgnify:FL=1